MVPRTCPVLGHNDLNEGNVLIKLNSNEDVVPIDYEYGGWNPAAYDVGNYFCEMVFDNAHFFEDGVILYLDNFPSLQERKKIIKKYMKGMHKLT